MNKLNIIGLLALSTLLTACGSNGLDELKRLCKKDAGLTIYKTVKADGYYDGTTQCHHCWHGLINTPFRYIEFCDIDSERHPLMFILKKHGCYRLSKVKRNSGQCHAKIDEDISKRVTEPFASFKKEQCISVQSIGKPSVAPGLFLENNEGLVERDDFGISRYEHTIKSVGNNQVYGKYINYSLVVKSVGGAQHVCNSPLLTGNRVSVKNPSLYKTFISKIIQSNK